MTACSERACVWPMKRDGLCAVHLAQREQPRAFARYEKGEVARC